MLIPEAVKRELLKIFKSILDDGEAETILLAETENLPFLLDEKKGRRSAKSLGLKTQGSLGTIVKAKKLGLTPTAKDVIETILREGYYIRPDLIEEVLKVVNED